MAGPTRLLATFLLITISLAYGSKSHQKPSYDRNDVAYKTNRFQDYGNDLRNTEPWEYDDDWDNYSDEYDDYDDSWWEDQDDNYDIWQSNGEWMDDDEFWQDDPYPWQEESESASWHDDSTEEDSWEAGRDDDRWYDDSTEEDSWEDDRDDDQWEDDSTEEDSWEDDDWDDESWENEDDADWMNDAAWRPQEQWDPNSDESWEGDNWKWSDESDSTNQDWDDYLDDSWSDEEDYDDWDEEDYDISSFWQDNLEDKFQTLLEENDYDGATLGVVKNGRLVFARGYGMIGDRNLHSSTVMPISSLSKTLTATAILQLAQDGYLSLSDEVFGDNGLLSAFSPGDVSAIDPRIFDITVEDLLRHAGGWDETVGPIYDPMMNELYQRRGENVGSIATALNLHGSINQYNIIQYMMKQPLQFAPGTKYRYSNFGYSVLGRVIEQVTAMPYEEYVQNSVLTPAGMMHTRVGPRRDDEDILWAGADENREINSQALHRIVHPQLLDSTLGWYSNVHDMHRFAKCLLEQGSCNVLHPQTVRFMLERPPVGNPWHEDTWRAIGLHVTAEGAVWQDSDLYDNDVIFYHQAMPESPYANEGNVTLIALTTNNRYKRLRSPMQKYAEEVEDWPADMRDVAIDELCMAELMEPNDDILVKFALSEHHMTAYMNALKVHNYYPVWVHGHTWLGISDFIVIAHRAKSPQDLDFEFFLSSDIKHFYNHLADLEEQGYQMSLVQSYKSFSHDGLVAHYALMKRTPPLQNQAVWQVNVPLDEYLSDLGTFTQKGFSVRVQSVEQHGQDEYVSYMMMPSNHPEGDYLAYHSLSQEQLEFLVKSQSLQNYHLTYLDTYRNNKDPVFSAVFHKGTPLKWLLQTDVEEVDLAEQAIIWHAQGYTPVVIVGYELHDHGLRYTGLWTKPAN